MAQIDDLIAGLTILRGQFDNVETESPIHSDRDGVWITWGDKILSPADVQALIDLGWCQPVPMDAQEADEMEVDLYDPLANWCFET